MRREWIIAQKEANRATYLQFPERKVCIHDVNSMESLQLAADAIGISLSDEWETPTRMGRKIPYRKSPAAAQPPPPLPEKETTVKVEMTSLVKFLEDHLPIAAMEERMKGKSKEQLHSCLQFRSIVGLDSEWQANMGAQNPNLGASILQVLITILCSCGLMKRLSIRFRRLKQFSFSTSTLCPMTWEKGPRWALRYPSLPAFFLRSFSLTSLF